MSHKHQMTRLVALGCFAWGVTSGIPTQVNLATAQIPENEEQLLLAQNNRQRATNDAFTADLTGCSRQGRTVRCTLLFINKADGSRSIYCELGNITKLYDRSGNAYLCSEVQAGNVSGEGDAYTQFPQGIGVKVVLTFNGIPESINDFALLEIYTSGSSDNLKFRNVRVSR